MKQQSAGSILVWILIVVVSVGMGVMWIFTPESADDLWFRHEFNGYISQGYDTFGAIIAQLSHRIERDNIRLANVLFVLQLPLKCEWLAGVFIAACWAAMWVYIRKIYHNLCAEPLAMAVSICALLYLLPWKEYMFSHDFAINYIFPSAFSVISFYYFIQLALGKLRNRYALYAILLITGFAHEAFAIPLFAAFGLFTVLFLRRDKHAWTATLCLLPGILLFAFTALGVRYRAIGGISTYGQEHLTRPFIVALWLSGGIAVYVVWRLARHGFVLSVRNVALFLSAIIMAISVAIRMAVHGTDRAGWCALVFETIVLVMLLLREPLFRGRIMTAAQYTVSILILAGLSVHFASTTIDTFRLRSWYYPALEQLKASPDDRIFCEMKGLKDYSRLSFGRPFRYFTIPGYVMQWIGIYYKDKGDSLCVFFPAELEDVDVNPGRKVAGDNPFYEKGGFLYCPESLWPSGESGDWYVDGIRNVRYEFEPFTLPSGSRYYFVTCSSVSFSKMKADSISPAR